MGNGPKRAGCGRTGWCRRAAVLPALVLVVAAGQSAGALPTSGVLVPGGPAATWFAPYVDATLPPAYPIATQAADPASQTAFGFVVSRTSTDCVPSWGTYYTLTQADHAPLRMSAVFGQMEKAGEVPIVSFGGESNTPLADACGTEASLEAAYRSVLTHYGLMGKPAVFDFDVEGAAQGDTAALLRQAAAVSALQAATAARGGSLGVWLTLPVTTQGLLPAAETVVQTMVDAGVRLSGVNVMTMYFSPSPGDGAPMLAAVTDALDATHAQLSSLFAGSGIPLTSGQVWMHEGATVQIGDAGIPGQAFTVADAQGLTQFARSVGLGRVSLWSINQDQACGGGATGGYSTHCSNVAQAPLAFDTTFSALAGAALSTPLLPPAAGNGAGTGGGPGAGTAGGPGAGTGVGPGTPVPPGTYPAWSPLAAYPGGYTVLLGATVYRAKWWNQDQQPVPVRAARWDTPWAVVGTVPAGTVPWTPRPLPAGKFPAWSATTVYTAGMEVLFQGLLYQDKWWTRGTVPSPVVPGSGSSPWRPMWTVPSEPVS